MSFNVLILQIGYTALHYASQNGHITVVKLLIEHNVHIDVPANVRILSYSCSRHQFQSVCIYILFLI